jgi:methylenetetrahydrofolate reductase (NADPH)
MVDDLAERGVTKPVIAGVMPITNLKSIKRMADMSGAAVPPEVVARLTPYEGDDEAVRAAGVEVATELCAELIALGVPGIQFYTLNRSSATRDIYKNLGLG